MSRWRTTRWPAGRVTASPSAVIASATERRRPAGPAARAAGAERGVVAAVGDELGHVLGELGIVGLDQEQQRVAVAGDDRGLVAAAPA